MKFTTRTKLTIAKDSNFRSTTWHDVLTNYRGKLLEEFLASNQLHVINENSARTMLQSARGSSNIDFTVVNNQVLAAITDWDISEEGSCSDHNLIKFNLNFANDKAQTYNFLGTRYVIKGQHTAFYKNFLQLISKNFQTENNEENTNQIDEESNTSLKGQKYTGGFMREV